MDRSSMAACAVPGTARPFALIDGHIVNGPATFPQPRFEARINGERVEVRALPV
jgi:hypothetical protein